MLTDWSSCWLSPRAGAPPVRVQLFSSVQADQHPGGSQFLVCIISGLKEQQDVLWWMDETLVASPDVRPVWTLSGGLYSATAVWELPAAQWTPTSTYWCGTVQEGQLIRHSSCWGDGR